jgi:death-on-curing protein
VDEPRFLTLDEVLYLHDESLERFGGSAGIREPGLVESALGSAQNVFWYGQGDLFEIAAAYAFHIAQSQAFLDGNKRTAVSAAIVFLRINRIRFPEDDGSVYRAMIEIAEKRLDKHGLAQTLRRLVESARQQ